MKKTSTIVLTMARRFQASPVAVFNAWTKPEFMKKWLFTTESTNQLVKNDFRVGGIWEIVDRREGVEYRATGEYQQIDVPHRLGFSYRMPQFSDLQDQIIIWISPVENACEMTFKQEIIVPHEESWSESDLENAIEEYSKESEDGWNRMFDELKQVVENGEIKRVENP